MHVGFNCYKNIKSKVHFFMLSKNQIKLISSLQQKKHRFANQLFFAEGVKVIQELLNQILSWNIFTPLSQILTKYKV
jgi:hypothetical protein